MQGEWVSLFVVRHAAVVEEEEVFREDEADEFRVPDNDGRRVQSDETDVRLAWLEVVHLLGAGSHECTLKSAFDCGFVEAFYASFYPELVVSGCSVVEQEEDSDDEEKSC